MHDRESVPDGAALLEQLEQARAEFHNIRATLSEQDWRAPSLNRGWTNGEVMFHVTLGFIVVSRLVGLTRLLSRLPAGFSLVFATILNFFSPVFNRVNALGARGGARIFSRERIGSRFDRAHARLVAIVGQMSEDEWSAGMYYPAKWDSLFRKYMTIDEVVAYPVKHLRFHGAQLSRPLSAPSAMR
jgi:hypothetical protein